MDYLVLSDSHGRTEMIDRAMEVQLRAPDAVLFLGDGMRWVALWGWGARQ